ncbi:hypothetical protein PV325_005395, partial [Microctonus aethiopoides]
MARPRPSPFQTPSAAQYLKMQEAGPGPLTPPPIFRASGLLRGNGPPTFAFHNDTTENYSQYGKGHDEKSAMRVETYLNLRNMSNRTWIASYTLAQTTEVDSSTGYELRHKSTEDLKERLKDYSFRSTDRNMLYQRYDIVEDPAELKYTVPSSHLDGSVIRTQSEESRCNLTDLSHTQMPKNQHYTHKHVKNDSRGSFDNFNFANSDDAHEQMLIGPNHSSRVITKLLQNSEIHSNDLRRRNENTQNIKMTTFRDSNVLQDEVNCLIRENTKVQGSQRVSQYIQSLPDVINDDSLNNEAKYNLTRDEGEIISGEIERSLNHVRPPTPPESFSSMKILRKDELTTGERIFRALRSVTSQSYIDASEFYNSVLTTAQQVPKFTFSTVGGFSVQQDKHSSAESLPKKVTGFYDDGEQETISTDGQLRTFDLYSPELNLAAQRTAQE